MRDNGGGNPFGNRDFFGAASAGQGGDFETLARQYWGAMGEAMRMAVPGAQPAPLQQPWQAAMDAFGQQATGFAPQADMLSGRFDRQARQWFGQMQQVAAQFAGGNAAVDAAGIGAAWKQALGGESANPFPDLFKAMQGPGQQGMDGWMRSVAPMFEQLQGDGRSWLGLPTFGSGREQQQRRQQLLQAWLDYQRCDAACNGLMAGIAQSAFRGFEEKLTTASTTDKRIGSARALFDTWIDAAEEAYAPAAMSPEFGQAYGNLINAQMRVRAGVQREIEDLCAQVGMPTRTEVDGAWKRIAELERTVRRLRDAVEHGVQPATAREENAERAAVPATRTAKATKTASKVVRKAAKAVKPAAPAKVSKASTSSKASDSNKSRKAAKASKAAKAGKAPKASKAGKAGKVARARQPATAAKRNTPTTRKTIRRATPARSVRSAARTLSIATPRTPQPLASSAGKRR